MTLGERFFKYRVKNNLTQEQFAAKMCVGSKRISLIETGKSKGSKKLEMRFEMLEKGELE